MVRVRGGLKEHLRCFHTVDSAIICKREIEGQALKSNADLHVTSIEPLGVMALFGLTVCDKRSLAGCETARFGGIMGTM